MPDTILNYEYENALGGGELRILTLQPSADFSSDLSCELETLPRAECKDYTALSYCWGRDDQRKVHITILNGQSAGLALQIRENLATALRYLRWRHEPRKLWIDAICINQDDKHEKSAQVKRMAKTYKDSSKVVIWLGPGSDADKTHIALEAIDKLGSQLDSIPLKDIPQATVEPELDIGGCGMWEYLIAMIKLQQNDWFTRLWVIQEICLAPKEATIKCGPHEASFWKLTHLQLNNTMMNFFKALQVYLPATDYPRHRMLALANEPPVGLTRQYFVAARQGITEPAEKECTLLSHLWNFRNRECSDPRDRVYALLGIAQDKFEDLQELIEPDYTKLKEDVYTAATKAIIGQYSRLDVLGMCHGAIEDLLIEDDTHPAEREEASGTGHIPSWVPDFHLDSTLRPTTGLTKYTSKDHYFTASMKSVANVTFGRSSEMNVAGYSLDTIEDLGCYNYEGTTWEQTLEQSRYLAVQQARKASSKYLDTEDAFWRTLITNRTRFNGLPSQEDEGEGFKTWWKTVFSDYEPDDFEQEPFHHFRSSWLQHFHFRNFFTTRDGYIGLCPLPAKPGDELYLLAGSQVPFVLRPRGGKYHVIGECYVHGIMQGEVWKESKCEVITLA